MTRYEEPHPGELQKYLPAIFRGTGGFEGEFLRTFLAAFEKILIGRGDDVEIPPAETLRHSRHDQSSLHRYHEEEVRLQGLETTIDHVADLFDPDKTWDEFLPWLASWAAFSLREDLPHPTQREFLSQIFQLYHRRGTKKNLEKLLTIFTVGVPEIAEDAGRTHHFKVKLALMKQGDQSIVDPEQIERQIAIAYALIDLEKPAHTSYVLEAEHVTMQIGARSTIGKDTLLGVLPTA